LIVEKEKAKMDDLKDLIFIDCDNLVENGYADDWNGMGQSVYDADPKELLLDHVEQTGILEGADEPTIERAVGYVREWQDARRPK
jgi:hypothetical protein